jgi:signal transduction histidine kinase
MSAITRCYKSVGQVKHLMTENHKDNLNIFKTPETGAIINAANAAMWEYDVFTKKVRWSSGFYTMLGYEPGEIECSANNFINNLLYYEDKTAFLAALKNKKHTPLVTGIRLLTKNGYNWFESSSQQQAATILTGTIVNIHRFKLAEFRASRQHKFTTDTNNLAKLGRWDLDVATGKLAFDQEAFTLIRLRPGTANIGGLLAYFDFESGKLFSAANEECLRTGRPYELDLKLNTAGPSASWVKMKAVGKIDDLGRCFAVKGIIQDIDRSKQYENELNSSLSVVSRQKDRLQNFAYIVAHNLRSYAGNLQVMVNLHEEAAHPAERLEIYSHIKTISSSLNATIEHLNEIVQNNAELDEQKKLVAFEPLFVNVLNALQSNIQLAAAQIDFNFDQCPDIFYLPAYLESIFHNLLSNALKYRDPHRRAVISCVSSIENGHTCLTFQDNGLGIDLNKYGDKLFGRYETFHHSEDSQGLGLYITRKQIEELGGSITVESTVNVGTKFILKFD